MSNRIRIRRDLSTAWASANPILGLGEMGLETDTRKTKFGDGSSAWNSLPYSVDKSQIGLGNVDNTSDANKPISSATQTAINAKADASSVYTKAESDANYEPKNTNIQSHIADTSNPHATTKSQIGLGNVPNIDATDRSNHTGTQLASTISDFSTAAQSAVISQNIVNNDTTHSPSVDAVHDALAAEEAARVAVSDRVTDIENDYGVAGGLATLDNSGKISTSMLPGTVLEYKGTWDAFTNTPTLQNGSSANAQADAGHIYRVSVAGTVNFGAGNIAFSIGDDVILSESLEWQRSPGGSLVIAVNGYQGDVTLNSQDILLTSPVASASDVQHALENINSSVAASITTHEEATDPHPQYLDETRGDSRYYKTTQVDTFLSQNSSSDRDRANHTGTQLASTISDFTSAVQAVTIDASKIDGGSVSNAEFSTLDGINTGLSIQAQIDEKQAIITGAASTITDLDLSLNKVVVSDSLGKISTSSVTSTELSYVSGVSSSIQTQLNNKEPSITAGTSSQYYRGDKTFQTLDKTAVGLSNVDNISAANLRDRSTHTGNETTLSWNETTTPSAPASGLTTYSKAVGGRQMYAQIGKSGVDYSFQPFIARNRIVFHQATGNATTLISFGAAAPSATGTATARNVATTNAFSWMRRVGYVSTATAGSASGIRSAVLQFGTGNGARLGGFHVVIRFGISDAALVANARTFVGLTATTTAFANAEPSTFLNMIGMGHDAADSNFQIMYNDAAGAATKVDLGVNFTRGTTNTDMYELALYCAPNGTTIYYQVVNLSSNVETSGTITTNIPLNTQLLTWQAWRSNNATAAAVGLDIASIYVETDN